MKQYEITFITKEPFDVAQGKDQKNPVKAEIEALGGKILNVSSIGQKNFTYTIKKEKSGFYTTVAFAMEPQKLMDLNKKIALKEEVLRHLIILYKAAKVEAPKLPKLPVSPSQGGPKPEKTLPKEEVKLPEPPKEIEMPKEIEAPKEEKKAPAKKVPQKKVEKVTPGVTSLGLETKSEEERMEELDKKLDELLKE